MSKTIQPLLIFIIKVLVIISLSNLLLSCNNPQYNSGKQQEEILLNAAAKKCIDLGYTSSLAKIASKQIKLGLKSQATETLMLAARNSTDSTDKELLNEIAIRIPEIKKKEEELDLSKLLNTYKSEDRFIAIKLFTLIGAIDKAKEIALDVSNLSLIDPGTNEADIAKAKSFGLIIFAEILAINGLKNEFLKVIEEIKVFYSDIITPKDELRIAKCYISLGIEEEAKELLSRSIPSWSSIEDGNVDPFDILSTTVEVAILYEAYGDYQEAVKILQKPLEIVHRITDYYTGYRIGSGGQRFYISDSDPEIKLMKAELKNKSILVLAYGYARIGKTEFVLNLLESVEPDNQFGGVGYFNQYLETHKPVGIPSPQLSFIDLWSEIAPHIAKSGNIELARKIITIQQEYIRFPMYQLIAEESLKNNDIQQCQKILEYISEDKCYSCGQEGEISRTSFLALEYAKCNQRDRANDFTQKLIDDKSWSDFVIYERSLALAEIGTNLLDSRQIEEAKILIEKAHKMAKERHPDRANFAKRIEAQVDIAEAIWRLDEAIKIQ